MPPRTAVILVGGPAVFSGHNLADRPRILLPIAGYPLLTYMASNLHRAGVERLIVCPTPSEPEFRATIERALQDIPFRFETIVLEAMLGTGGSLKQAEDLLRGESFWVLGSDAFMRADLQEMISLHRKRKSLATLAAVRLLNTPWQMERVEMDPEKGVKTVHRMHPCQEKRSMLRPISLYLFEPQILDLIPPNSYYDLKEQLFSTLYNAGNPASVWEAPEHTRTIVSVDEYIAANQDQLLGRVRFPELEDGSFADNSDVRFLGPVAAGKGLHLSERATVVGPAVIEDINVGAQSVIVGSIVMRNAQIGAGVHLNHCLVGEGAVIEDGVFLRDVVVPMNSRVTRDSAETIPLETDIRSNAPLLKWMNEGLSSGLVYRIAKRAVDLAFAVPALFVLSPLMLLIALAVKLDSPGKVFYTQTRCGKGGKKFSMVKFRTMVSNSDQLKRELKSLNEVDGPTFKLTNDPRVTRIGKLLRETNLDEIPQLINVINGDMSLIGPRPLSMDEMCYNPMWRDTRLRSVPGLTGLWQVEAHSKAQFSEWIRHDLTYAKNACVSFDTQIFFRTLNRFTSDIFDFLWKPKKQSKA